MHTIFIFHGVDGDPNENWLPWMKKEFEEAGHRVIIPTFPHSNTPTLDEWMQEMERYEKQVDEGSIFVGHSLGAAFALRLTENMHQCILGSFLVAPVWEVMGNSYDTLMLTFTTAPYDWMKVKSHCKSFFVIQGEGDPYISLAKSQTLQKNLGATLMIIPNGKHLNTTAGFREFPQLRDAILREITT